MPFGWCDYSTPEGGGIKLNSSPIWLFKPAEDLAKATAEELEASGLFKEVFYTQRASEGDLVFLGTINSTHYSGTMISYGLSAYGPLLWFLGLPCGSVHNELAVGFSLVDRNNKVLWSNNYKRDYDKSPIIIYSLPSDFQYDSLYKEIMLESITDIEKSLEVRQSTGAVYQLAPEEVNVVLKPSGYTENQEISTIKEGTKEQPKEDRTATTNKQSTIASYPEYYRLLHRTISGAVVKPEGSGSGTINATFTLLSDGTLEDVQILEGSVEDGALRAAVVKAIKDSAPFPAFPYDMRKKSREAFTITLEFRYR